MTNAQLIIISQIHKRKISVFPHATYMPVLVFLIFTLCGHTPGACVKCSSSPLPGVFPKDMHVISTDENQVFAAVQEWNQNDMYNLYISDTRGVYFTLALENVQSSRGPEGNVMIDLYEVCHKACVVFSHCSALTGHQMPWVGPSLSNFND